MSNRLKNAMRNVLERSKKRRDPGAYRSLKDGDLANPIPLDDFLVGVGEIMRLAPRKSAAPEKPVAAARPSLPKNWSRYLWWTAALLLIPFLMPRRQSELPSAPLPAGVAGSWSTADPRYADRRFEIGQDFILFKNGERADEQTVHPISNIQAEEVGDSTLVHVKYLDAGATYELSFKYSRFPTRAIRFSHQPEFVWRPLKPTTPAGP